MLLMDAAFLADGRLRGDGFFDKTVINSDFCATLLSDLRRFGGVLPTENVTSWCALRGFVPRGVNEIMPVDRRRSCSDRRDRSVRSPRVMRAGSPCVGCPDSVPFSVVVVVRSTLSSLVLAISVRRVGDTEEDGGSMRSSPLCFAVSASSVSARARALDVS